jgi:hypothetical protein
MFQTVIRNPFRLRMRRNVPRDCAQEQIVRQYFNVQVVMMPARL